MKKRYKSGLMVSALATAALMAGVNAFGHPSVPLRDATGAIINNSTTAYSPKATCGACHNKVVTYDADGIVGTADDEGTTSTSGARGSYAGGGATRTVIKTQGLQNEVTGEAEWVTYTVEAYKHGFVTGRHSQQGRNEDYGNHLRHALGGKFWESSPGMFGKY
ncbi:MAG: hypothetical protein ACOY32_10125 [Thermodesulfobacteriota bacterium]